MLSNFLGVKAEQNLRDLSYPVSSFRKLRERLAVELDQFRWMIYSFLRLNASLRFQEFFDQGEHTAGQKKIKLDLRGLL